MSKTTRKANQRDKESITNGSHRPPECFVIMPFSDREGYKGNHFTRVYEDIFKIAIQNAGYKPVRGDDVKQSNLIHLDILQRLLNSPMAICDLTAQSPNVLFELGLRQAFDKPTVLVQDETSEFIFDIASLRHTIYRKSLRYREVLEDQKNIEIAIKSTYEARQKKEGVDSIVSLLSLNSPATLKEISNDENGKMLQILLAEVQSLKSQIGRNELSPFGSSNMFGAVEVSKKNIEVAKKKQKEKFVEIMHRLNRIQDEENPSLQLTSLLRSLESIESSLDPDLRSQYDFLHRKIYQAIQEAELPF